MHRKRVFLLAAVFLVVALVVPPVIVILQTNNTIYKYIIPGISPTARIIPTLQLQLLHRNVQTTITQIIVAAIIEVVFIILFAITIYYGINHTHPEH